MKKFLTEFSIFAVSTVISLAPFSFEVSLNSQRIITLLMIMLIVFTYKLASSNLNVREQNTVRWFLVFISTLLIQFSVISNGGVYSPFFVLIHIYALGLAVFLGLRASLIFLGFSMISLFGHMYMDQRLDFITNDPASITIYALSFMIIIPFSHFVAKQYHLKQSIAELLTKQVYIDKTVFDGISEMVVITDLKLNILSINDQVERTLALSRNEIIGQSLLHVIFLRAQTGIIKEDFLSVDRVIAEGTTRVINGLSLFTKNRGIPQNVTLTLKPVTDPHGTIEQITIIIREDSAKQTTPQLPQPEKLFDITNVQLKHQAMVEDLKNKLWLMNLKNMSAEVHLIENLEEDLVLMTELEQKQIKPQQINIDLAQLLQRTVSRFQHISSLFNINATFMTLNFTAEDIAPHVPKGLNLSPMQFTSIFFTAPVDVKWFTTLIEKLLFVAMLLGLGNPKGSTVAASIERYDDKTLRIVIDVPTIYMTTADAAAMVFKKNYGTLAGVSSFGLASGMEGVLAEMISKSLKIPVIPSFDPQTKKFTLQLFITK